MFVRVQMLTVHFPAVVNNKYDIFQCHEEFNQSICLKYHQNKFNKF